MEKYPSLHSKYPQLPLFASHTPGPQCLGVVGWRVETEPTGMPDSAGWDRPSALSYFGMKIGAATPAFGSASVPDSALVLTQEGAEEVGSLALGVNGFNSGSISSLSDTLWQNVLTS